MSESLPRTFQNRLVGGYLDALSGGVPAPGGGSAAGLAGALGCGLGAMVCNLTLNRGPNERVAELVQVFLDAQHAMLRQAEADETAFTAYREASTLPRSTIEEKTVRRAAMERALVGAAEVPLEMVTLGLEALGALRATVAVGTEHALGDLSTGAFLIQAMILGSLENIEANARLMKDPHNRDRFEEAAKSARTDLDVAMSELREAKRRRETIR